MNKILRIIFAIGFLLVLFGANITYIVAQSDDLPILYIDESCEFCEVTENYIEENDLEENIIIRRTEQDKEELRKTWNNSEIPERDRAYPFLLIEEDESSLSYITGDIQIRTYLAENYDTPYPDELIDVLESEVKEEKSDDRSENNYGKWYLAGAFLIIGIIISYLLYNKKIT